jgi:23S rRNA (pseudouridine1915-N3)-methyltransferase
MKIKVICVGKLKEKNILNLCSDYSKKINYDAKLELLELKDSNPLEEGKKIIENLDKIKDNKFVFILSEEGKEYTSIDFSEKTKKMDLENKLIVFVIGGPFGLSQEVKKKADMLLSLSKMTFTHEMARLFLLEQIYRGVSIIKNKSYHKQ